METESKVFNINASQTDKQNSNSNKELVKTKEVKGTPFTIISLTDTKEHFAALGQYRVTEKHKTRKAAEEEVKEISWNRIVQVCMILNEKMKDKSINEINK